MSKLLDFIFDGWGKAALGAGLFAAIFTWWQIDRLQQRNLGAAHVRTEANEKAGEIAEKARAARDAVDDATALDGLRQRFCRDC
jgi:hypothetical protein